jgi:hypothetical protein
MNEQILKLLKQSGLQPYYDAQEAQIEKFAELIVRDCIAIVAPSSYRRAYPENYRGGIDCLDTLDERVGAIKDHFGIE